MFAVVKAMLMPKYGVCPVLVIVVVSLTVAPGDAVAGLAALTLIVSDATATATAQRASPLPPAGSCCRPWPR